MWINLVDVLEVGALVLVAWALLGALRWWDDRRCGPRPADGRSWDDVGGPITPTRRT